MATNLIATAATAADSDEFIVVVGTPVNICLKAAARGASVQISRKDDDGAWVRVGDLTTEAPDRLLIGAGTYRVSRIAGATCGVFRD